MVTVIAGLLFVILVRSGCDGVFKPSYHTNSGLISKRRDLEQRSANNYLVKKKDGWYLNSKRNGLTRKLIGQGMIEPRGLYRAVADNGRVHIFHNPPPEFIEYLLSLPVMYEDDRLTFNGTAFLVRPAASAPWRHIILDGVQNADRTLHVCDTFGHWYRFHNTSKLLQYLAKVPKTVAVSDNHLSERSGNGWGIRTRGGRFRSLEYSGETLTTLHCENGLWYTVRNPPSHFLNCTFNLTQVVFDPYNLTLSDEPTALPLMPTPSDHPECP